ncbi:methylated-DNA--[protein]-cysteine S-methyltransferase [Lysinibacillus agricola]|uniref:Methylated-DNA--protein-cysteine methyltransferase n=1 Tax=Lysinibacillus agricola TaxID=2590012 RepID=A0ABX7AW52_9BACI|nr:MULTISPECIES: methylated-DNA--[protein]-cysteine S-methyltransferase [Lysinibacillus]KOS63593.1 cysteine methyltransferase [Lysinibacillus sp. FJAT-14222]QQP14079.1 methylated-DNA--[protein]-cysteine S-methyltransferase [Lysinibacillus agricola]
MKQYKLDYHSPIGIVEIVGSDTEIYSIMFSEQDQIVNAPQKETPQVLLECQQQLHEYFIGERHEFTFSYAFEGTSFQKEVWTALTSVVYGETATYKETAVSIGNEKAVRAVGSANGKNKLSIVVPCHRIIGSNGTLTGYAGGMWRKEWLLQHEKSNSKTI